MTLSETKALAKEKLLAAADLLETKGWTQGALARNEKGFRTGCNAPEATCFCAAGAIFSVFDLPFAVDIAPRAYATINYLRELVVSNTEYMCIPDWNDDPDQTAENVVATMRAAANSITGA